MQAHFLPRLLQKWTDANWKKSICRCQLMCLIFTKPLMLNWSKFKICADDKTPFIHDTCIVVDYIVGKGEIAGSLHLFPFPTMFSEAFRLRVDHMISVIYEIPHLSSWRESHLTLSQRTILYTGSNCRRQN